ncbi:hypothetical protein [Rhizobium sp. Kim5]|uniref:glycine-rich domain-containing protein n=1 Tax=Rhizobium sp. Kim5 TaxID=2020311 RepID=UPI000F73744C|nr:hypothetical protein [Rhizobium sp. Kim5]
MKSSEPSAGAASLQAAPHAKLSSEQHELLQRLGRFSAPYLKEKLLSTGKIKSSDEYDQAFSEFKKFSALTVIYPDKSLGMVSEEIDEVWHQFILFTHQYQSFGDDILGRYLHHVPDTSETRIPDSSAQNFFQSYNEVFGPVPDIWGAHDLNQFVAASGCDASASCTGTVREGVG